MFVIRDREAGNVIDKFDTLEEAQEELRRYEEEDRREETYTEDFYEIVETNRKYQQAEFDKNNTVQVKIKLNKNTDSDIINYLNELDNKQGKIKELLRTEIKAQN